jgi:alpha-ketoglutarate-dependent dioxygenase FTO
MAKSGSKKKSKKSALPFASVVKKSDSENKNNDKDGHLPQVFPRHRPRPPKGNFLRDESPYRDSFEEALRGPYEGFVVDEAEALVSSSVTSNEDCSIKENTIQSSLESMKQNGFFRTDVTQPFGLGTKCAKTYVTRCLVGNPGTTYKYLGLRMFSHPWMIDADDTSTNNLKADRKRMNRKRPKRTFDGCDGGKSNNPYQGDSRRAIAEDASTIRELSQNLTKRTMMHLRDLDDSRRQRRALATKGRSDFDICLINRMESSSDLKPFVLGGGSGASGIDNNKHKNNKNKITNKDATKTSVSWHADSSLEHYSTIAVYQTLLGGFKTHHGNKSKDKTKDKTPTKGETNAEEGQWWVALRVAPHSEGPQASQKRRGTNIGTSVVEETPPIAVTLPSGSAYYLLDDFNHHHQHTVLTTGKAATAGVRYSCTFRLLRDSHNVRDWIDRGNAAIRQFHKKGAKIWRSEQLLLTEIESEWIRQFFIQGTGNQNLLWESYWKAAIEELLSIWSQLEYRTKQTMDLFRAAAEEKCGFDTIVNKKSSGSESIDRKPTKAERKARDRRKKSLEKIEELVSRVSSNDDYSTMHNDATGEIAYVELYQPFAELLEERAEMRELWGKREKDHVFHDMTPDCRPMKAPFKYEQATNESNGSGRECFGMSPLPKSPAKLKEMSKQLVQCGQAFREGDISLLPPLWKLNKPNSDSPIQEELEESNHTKPMDWSGWSSLNQVFGLELQHPWAGAVVDGKKSIETRSYTLPPSLIGKKIMIIQSSSGQAGISSLGNSINISDTEKSGGNKIVGWCIFSSVKVYTTEKDFRAEDNLHLVRPDSGYGWKNGVTKKIYGWIVEEQCRSDELSSSASLYDTGVRRFRSLFELCRETKTMSHEKNEKKKAKRSSVDRKNKENGKKKKRKRY